MCKGAQNSVHPNRNTQMLNTQVRFCVRNPLAKVRLMGRRAVNTPDH